MCITEKQILDIVKPEFEKLRDEFSDAILKSHNEMARLIHRPSPETLEKIRILDEAHFEEREKIRDDLAKADKEKKEAIQRIEDKLEEHNSKEQSYWDMMEEIKKMVELHHQSIDNIDRALNGDSYHKKGMIQQNDEMYELLTRNKGGIMWIKFTLLIGALVSILFGFFEYLKK